MASVDFSKIDKDKYYYDEYEADRACRFIQTFCTHVKGELAGKPFILEDWQKDEILKPLFGWKRRSDNKRKYREAFIFLPRKNGKTTLTAAISIYQLLCDGEQGGESVFCAADREQARIAMDVVKGIINNNTELRKVVEVYKNSIVFPQTNSFIKILSSDADTKHGFNTSFGLLDELHVHKNAELYEVIKTSTGARSQPLIISITTAGANKNHICHELYDYSKKILSGIIEDETFLPVIYEGREDLPIDSVENLKLANPSFGNSISEEYLLKEAKRAKDLNTYLNTFKRLHLNLWTDSTESFISDLEWQKCGYDYGIEDLRGEACYAGLDLANNRDLNSLVLLFPQKDGSHKTLTFTFYPANQADRKNNIAAGRAFVSWARDEKNLIFLTQGESCGESRDDDFIIEKIVELSKLFNIKSIAYDPWGADAIISKLKNQHGIKCEEFRQGYKSMSTPIKKLESLVYERKLNHNHNPILRWCLSNVRITKDPASNVKMDKEKSSEKIDAAVALVMALGIFLNHQIEEIENGSKGQRYKNDGFFFL